MARRTSPSRSRFPRSRRAKASKTPTPTRRRRLVRSATRPARRVTRRRRPARRLVVAEAPQAVRGQPVSSIESRQPVWQEVQAVPRRAKSLEERFAIPTGYGETQIVLMVKDPWWIYAYWEVQPSLERQVRSQLAPDEHQGLQSVLRVYDVTDRDFPSQPANHSFDIPLSGLANNWYIHVNAPNRSFVVDIGLLTRTDRFFTLARSNRVTTPRFGPSEIIDEEWMTTEEDYWKLFGVTAGIGMGSSPGALKALLERKLFSPGLFSPGLFSPMKVPPAKGFWLWVDTELIVHGATDPKATVTVQGQEVKLKSDGTFSVRMALPDGTQTIPVASTSPSGQETKTVTPIVTRQTEGQTSWRQETGDRRPETAAETQI